ncbi:hypothetical protein HK096_001084, partial [Nowakowskiella sp. JEL0078]
MRIIIISAAIATLVLLLSTPASARSIQQIHIGPQRTSFVQWLFSFVPDRQSLKPGDETTIVSCGTESDTLSITSVELIPDPPKRTHNVTFSIGAHLTKRVVPGAYANIKVKLGVLQVYNEKIDI